MASFDFDSTTIEATANNYDPLPAGWYTASITGAEVRQTKSGTGSYLRLEFTVSGPSGAGRKVWSNYNTRNENPKAETIGREQLAELCRAVGKPRLRDTDELLGANLSVKVKVREAANGYEASNEVQAHKALDGAAPAVATKATPPWAKK